MQPYHFVNGLRDVLRKTGHSQEEAGKYDFHGWRHFFTAYMAKKLDKKLLKGETGHLTDEMIDRYADHETVGDRELIRIAKRKTFAGLLPDQSNVMVFKKTAC